VAIAHARYFFLLFHCLQVDVNRTLLLYFFKCDYGSCFSQHVITSVIPGPTCGNIRAPLAFLVNPTGGCLVDSFPLSPNCVYRQGPSLGFFQCTITFLCDIIPARARNICTRSNVNVLSGCQLQREQLLLLQNSSHSGVRRCGESVFPLAGITNTIYHIVFDGSAASKHLL
jgi:hypothetical protein